MNLRYSRLSGQEECEYFCLKHKVRDHSGTIVHTMTDVLRLPHQTCAAAGLIPVPYLLSLSRRESLSLWHWFERAPRTENTQKVPPSHHPDIIGGS